MTESELYGDLVRLADDKGRWEESVPLLFSLLSGGSVKIRAKALWLLGEIGLLYPGAVKGDIAKIASFLESGVPLLRERALNALGRIGRGSFDSVLPYFDDLLRFASDPEPRVRLSFIWASENIASAAPGAYDGLMEVFAGLLSDPEDRVRMEAPEIFRVIGKRRPESVAPYLERLRRTAETDGNRVVRIHCLGAVRAAENRI